MALVELVQKSRMKTVSRFWLQLLRHYFRVEVEGIENVPRRGGAMILPNHSGFAGADAVLLAFLIKRATRRRARLLAHRAFFDFSKTLKAISESHGLKRASISAGIELLKKKHLLILFPEGEQGNFKPSYKRYQLQPFHTGFLRMSLPSKAPIVPCIIIGAEESHLNLGNLDFSRVVKNLRIPMPLNFIPLPAKWKIVFLPPIDPESFDEKCLQDSEELKKKAASIQRRMQKQIRIELEKRPYIYSRQTHSVLMKLKEAYQRIGEPVGAR